MRQAVSVSIGVVSENADNIENESFADIPDEVSVYEMNGPLFFGASDIIARIMLTGETKCLVLRMRGVSAIDATAMNALESLCDKCSENGITVILSHVNKQPYHAMQKSGLDKKIGKENFTPHITEALERAYKVIGKI